jgi:eukaryotic-like serine/threonine-protein kinase
MALTVASQVELIPGYRLLERLGQGGFGEVWKAEAPGGMLKAIKIIHGSLTSSGLDDAHVNQELKSLHRVKTIRHPFILSLERFDIVDGRLIIVSELADCTLFDRYKECRNQGLPGIPRDELLRYMRETAEALDLMNEQFHLQHLDIKPQNLFLLFNHVKVGDFGLVKDLQGMSVKITSGVTAVYAAPETFEGVVSRYCDQYNLAITFQELLTGQLPYDGSSGNQLMMQHMMGEPDIRPLPAGDQPVIARALSKKPEDRYPSCQALVQALCQTDAASAPELHSHPGLTSAPVKTPERFSPVPGSVQGATDPQTVFMRSAGRAASANNAVSTPPEPQPRIAKASTQTLQNGPLAKAAIPGTPYVPPPPPPERPETTGAGVVVPALVVGLGGLGREVLQEIRKSLRKRSTIEDWPHLRLLNIDTDPEAHEQATREPDSVLLPEEIMVTPFHRPSHYLKRSRDREEIQSWMPLGPLTNVPRGQTSAGEWRALGRLAFFSCASAVNARLRRELEACTDEKRLTEVARRTALGLRSTRPRVYVVTSLTGGTGSGMFLDVALAVRRTLQTLGHPRAEVVGVLLTPSVEHGAAPRAVANGFAALTELKHSAGAATAGNERDKKDAPSGQPPPFDRCVLLSLPSKADGPAALGELTNLAGDFLCRELTTPLGPVADQNRAGLREALDAGMICQTFGAYWFSVPRRPLLQRVAHHICDRLVRSWGVHDSKAIQPSIQTWVAKQITQANLSSAALAVRLQAACAAALGQTPSDFFDALIQQWGKGGAAELGRHPKAVQDALAELEKVLGPPDKEPSLESSSGPIMALVEASRALAEQAEAQLADLAFGALSEPQFRLASVEEAAQGELAAALEDAARLRKRECDERNQEAVAILRQIRPLAESMQSFGLFRGAAKARAATGIVTRLRDYLRARWDSVMALAVCRLFRVLHVNLHKYRRGVDCCHKRVGQFLQTFGAQAAPSARVDLGLGRYLLPFGCCTLEEAVAGVLDSLPPAEEEALRVNVWNLIRTTLQDHVHVCTAPASLFRNLYEGINNAVAGVAEASLGRAHAAEIYLERQAEHSDADADLAGAFDEAQPELGGAQRGLQREFSILAVPSGPEGERFRALVQHALPDAPMAAAASTDDIVFYRERSHFNLTDLPQMGALARTMYEQILASEPCGPHSRVDIVAW